MAATPATTTTFVPPTRHSSHHHRRHHNITTTLPTPLQGCVWLLINTHEGASDLMVAPQRSSEDEMKTGLSSSILNSQNLAFTSPLRTLAVLMMVVLPVETILGVYEDEMKRTSSSTSNSQNLAFLSSENTSSTNEVSTASGNFRVNTAGGTSLTSQVSSTPGADEVVCSFFAQQTMSPLIDNEDLQQIDQDDLKELDIRWQVAMLTVRVQRFMQKTGRSLYFKGKHPVTFDKSNNYNSEREKHSRVRLEIQGYELALESLESRIIGHEKNELAWGKKYEFQNYELKCREVKINNLKIELEKVVKERDELKVKIEKWEESSKGLNKLLNSQMNAKDKNGLGYGTQLDEISNKSETDSEISMSVFKVRSSDEEITPANDRFSKADGYHVVPPPITGNFLTLRADISFAGLDEYAIRKKIIESKTTKPEDDTSESKTSETVGKTNEVEKYIIKINRDKVIIEDWNSDDEDDVSEVNIASPVKTNETQTIQTQVDKIDQISQKEGIGFKKIKAYFVCKSTDHLIKDCDFYAKKSPKHKLKTMVNTGQRVVKPVWDNAKRGNPESILQDHAMVDSGCSSHMTGNKAYLSDYEDYNGGFVAFRSDPKGGKITGTGKIRTANLDFDDVYFVDELKFNLFSVSQMCDKINSILFTDTECLILSPSFKLFDESQVVLRAPRQIGVYSLDLKNIVPSRGITCLYANATTDESKLWHRRLGHVNFKNINKLVKGHLVRGLPSKVFVNDHTCVACKKGKQHKASCKAKLERTIRKPLELLHMDLFGPVSVESINKKKYCLVVTDDFSRFSWVFFLATKDETNEILYKFITGLENQLNHKVKIIRSDHGTEFKNHAMNEFCAKKGIKREFSVARTPQQNGVAERKGNYMTLIDGQLELCSSSLYLSHFRQRSKYCLAIKAFRVYNKRTTRVEENLHIDFLEDQPNVTGTGPNWMFDLDFLTNSMNYIPISVENQVNVDAGTQDSYAAVEDVAPTAHEKSSESSPKDNDVQVTEDVADKEGQHQMTEDEQVLHDELEKMIAQEVIAKALDDATDKAFRRRKEEYWHLKKRVSSGYHVLQYNKLCIGFRQEEGIDYDEVFAPVARIEAIRLFLAFASYMGFTVYQMDVKSAFLYGTIEEEVYVHQPLGFVDPAHPNKVYKVIKALYGLHQAPRAWYETLSSFLMENGFRRGTIDKTLFIKKKKSDIMLVQVYVDDIIFGSTKKSMCTEFEDYGEDVDVHVYRSMIGSLMYLTASRPDIMFVVCACARDSPFELEAFSEGHIMEGASLDRKSTTGGCQFLGRRLISWQCKKQTIMANSTTEAEYVAAANRCRQVLWIQNQMMDYGFNFMNTRIHIDNESTISVIKNPVAHSRTKHIRKFRFHIHKRLSNEKRLIAVIKIP
ncbi:putative ribonuclease H-like domain-containing protein [Tanacetum coccineum]|uniref:Ribonuclease H-like domain-containing protein n=1 Tax=Tanacetum coccineum TaxID=301880 RepID=A0ABQ5B5B4_9ASTR